MAVQTTDIDFVPKVLQSNIPVLVDFWAEWCAPCLMVALVIEEIAKTYQGKIKVCKVNVDEAPNTSSKYGIMNIPTLAIFKNGKLDKVVGVASKTQLETAIKPHI